jgi:hypothetical protein
MKKIIGCILLVIPLACTNPSHTESQNQQKQRLLIARAQMKLQVRLTM